VNLPKHLQKRILGEVLGKAWVVCHPEAQFVHAMIMYFVELLKSLPVSTLCKAHDFLVSLLGD
jgi:hypothetical protein